MSEKYHFIGIGGIGMSALAHILLEKQLVVSGSDITSNAQTSALKARGARIHQEHAATHIEEGSVVVYNSNIRHDNPEFQAAHALNCKLLHRSELLASLMQGARTFAVTGTHGKTTTSSLLTAVFVQAGLDPTFAIGGLMGGAINGKWGQGRDFIAEADESDGSFLRYHPEGAIVTNVEAEHLEHYKTLEALQEGFARFLSQVKNRALLFYWGDDPFLAKKAMGTSYGFSERCALRILNEKREGWESFFDIVFENKTYSGVRLSLAGRHNVLNAAAVFGLARRLGIEEETIREAFKNFSGVSRRCERKQRDQNVLWIDDYAHHPTEITSTLVAIKDVVQERRLHVIFQPHRYSRTRDLLHAFGGAFDAADHVYITDIYAASEAVIPDISPMKIVETIRAQSRVPCSYLPRSQWKEIAISPHDVWVTMGAGDITTLSEAHLPARKLHVALLFGGISCEHEISLRSARYVASSLDLSLYDVHYFGIDKRGGWITGSEAKEILEKHPTVESLQATSFLDPRIAQELEKCDLFLPVFHGTYGEDGTIQGLFEMLGKAYVGPDTRAAALCMDKVLTKRIVSMAGVPTPKDCTCHFIEWRKNKEAFLQKVAHELSFPLYVKPVHLGSSVGISRVERIEEVEGALEHAFRYDFQVLVEEGKEGCRELEFAVMGNTTGYEISVPPPGEKLAAGSFVDYEKKYGSQPIATSLDAHLESALLKKGQMLAKQAYQAMGCSGMTRVDFLLDAHGNYWLFEMNPIPGMQKLSLFPKIWSREGIPAEQLFNRLIILALQRKRQQDRHFQPI